MIYLLADTFIHATRMEPLNTVRTRPITKRRKRWKPFARRDER